MAKARRESLDEIQQRVSTLETFIEDLTASYRARTSSGHWHDEQADAESAALRSKINRSRRFVRDIVLEAGCMKAFTVIPPRTIGGAVRENIDPFETLFKEFYGHSFVQDVIDMIEETIGVVQRPGYLERVAKAKRDRQTAELARGLERVEQICRRFPRVVRQLQSRHANRGTFAIDDEYDVQDLLHALLRLDFDDIRHEEWTPSYAGGSARMDFLLKAENIVVEVKKARRGLGGREVGDELLVDIARYRAHPDCRSLVCFVYDPEFKIGNPVGLEKDLARADAGFDVRVIITPSER